MASKDLKDYEQAVRMPPGPFTAHYSEIEVFPNRAITGSARARLRRALAEGFGSAANTEKQGRPETLKDIQMRLGASLTLVEIGSEEKVF